MFEIKEKYETITSEIASISDNFHVFHYDEFPILYAGTNYLGNKIIGSLVCENEEGDLFRSFHFLVTNKIYNEFLKRKITYLNLIHRMTNLFVIDKDINDKIYKTYYIPVEVIPREYLPLENSYCPNVERAIGFDYSVSLQGGIADVHEAFSNTVAAVGKSADKILNKIGNALNIKSLNPHVHQLPSVDGSFKLKFRVKVDNNTLFYKEEFLKIYFQRCLDYSINTLPAEAKKLASGNIEDTVFEKTVVPAAKAVYSSLSYKVEDNYVEGFASDILGVVDEIVSIGSQVGNGFSGVEFIGADSESKDVAIGYIDKEYANDIAVVKQEIAVMPKKGEVADESYQEYRILVFDLNVDTRSGTAYVNNANDTDIMDKPKIRIEGEGDLSGSIFTESLHFNKWIIIKAKARSLNQKIRELIITFND